MAENSHHPGRNGFCSALSTALVSGTADEGKCFLAYVEEVTTEPASSSDSASLVLLRSFLLLLAWCLNDASSNSQVEALLLQILLRLTHTLSLPTQRLLHSCLKEGLAKLPLSSDG